MARRSVNVFSMSFLDAITCGFGAVVLVFMVINASARRSSARMTGELRAEVDRLETEVLEGQAQLVELHNSLRRTEDERRAAQGLSRQVLESLEQVKQELATYQADRLARRDHINRLQADLRSLEEDARRLSAQAKSREIPGDKVRSFVGDGDRQYLTGLKVGGDRILVLIDASASMLDETIVNVVRRRYLDDATKIRSGKWQQAVAAVDWLTTQMPRTSRFQIHTFNTRAQPVVDGSQGRWLDAGDRQALDKAVASLRQVVPLGGTSLHQAFASISTLSPPPDNLVLLTDGLPTQGSEPPRARTVSAKDRLRLYRRALERLPLRLPINVILFPMEGDPMAAPAYWKLAIATGGSFMTPSKDWP
jgi:hypothetical protein